MFEMFKSFRTALVPTLLVKFQEKNRYSDFYVGANLLENKAVIKVILGHFVFCPLI